MKKETKKDIIKLVSLIAMITILVFTGRFVGNWRQDKQIFEGFDFSESKSYWDESTSEYDFKDDRVVVILKKRIDGTYPKLQLRHFKLRNAKSIKYASIGPSRYAMDNEEYVSNYHQTLYIILKTKGKDRVLAAVKHIEKLEFVQFVSPSWYPYGSGGMSTGSSIGFS